MLRKKIGEGWLDSQSENRTKVCWSGCDVGRKPIRPLSLDIWIDALFRPNGKVVVSPADTSIVDEAGAAVVECSWARISEIPFSRIGGRCERLCKSHFPAQKHLLIGLECHILLRRIQ